MTQSGLEGARIGEEKEGGARKERGKEGDGRHILAEMRTTHSLVSRIHWSLVFGHRVVQVAKWLRR